MSTSIVMKSIKMTSETSMIFQTWLCTTMKANDLKSLQQWLDWMYRHSISENFKQKSVQSFKNVERQPVLTEMVNTNYEKLLKPRCKLCFNKIHEFERCHVYMAMTPNQRKIALTLYGGCFLCTKIVHSVHVGSSSNFCDRRNCWMPCENCHSHEHHFSICEASNEPFKAILKEY